MSSTPRVRRTVTTLLAVVLAATLLGLGAGSASAATRTVDIEPAGLSRGARPAVPYLDGNVVVDGARRTTVPGRTPSLAGASGRGYVVVTLVRGTWKTLRVGDGARRTLAENFLPEEVLLADDGATFAAHQYRIPRGRTWVTVLDARDGTTVRSATFRRYPRVLDLDGGRAVVGGPDGGAVWDVRTNRRTAIGTGFPYAADLGSNRLASFDKDPYDGGCSQVTTLSVPRTVLWRSCRQAVRSFSPDGSRIVTQDKLVDGLGPDRLRLWTVTGRPLATYTVGSFFGTVRWEGARTLLLDAYGDRRWATVRCVRAACERTTSLRRNPRF
ncbi:hypothetical protein [Nocardioides litoris]|uniref:hypothetical protein n=1 Tax=Nocardioides litoris TaxID=1926648 RepID=UPI00111E7227|nr:hypothetical protein [Nocardioides litoris]